MTSYQRSDFVYRCVMRIFMLKNNPAISDLKWQIEPQLFEHHRTKKHFKHMQEQEQQDKGSVPDQSSTIILWTRNWWWMVVHMRLADAACALARRQHFYAWIDENIFGTYIWHIIGNVQQKDNNHNIVVGRGQSLCTVCVTALPCSLVLVQR